MSIAHVPKRFASTAARQAHAHAQAGRPYWHTHVALSNVNPKAFPPEEVRLTRPARAVAVKTSTVPGATSTAVAAGQEKPQIFDAETWASLQPPNPASLSAFAHRIGLGSLLESASSAASSSTVPSSPEASQAPTALLQQALTHPSFVALHQKHRPEEPAPKTNAALAALGNALLGLFATEYVNAAYPYLPTRVMKAAVTAYVGGTTCTAVAKEMGAAPLIRWHRMPDTPTRPAVLHQDVMSTIPRALLGLVYTHGSFPAARRFVHRYFLARDIDIRNMIKFRDPKKALLDTVAKFGRERPVSRLLKETGRFSNAPVYVVAVYSGADKLGEGFGSSLKMAEFRAAEDALLRVYLTRQPPHLVQLPSSTFPEVQGSIFDAQKQFVPDASASYAPNLIGDAEILYGSADRTGVFNPGTRSRAAEEREL